MRIFEIIERKLLNFFKAIDPLLDYLFGNNGEGMI
jgi:hypothetical protein